MTVWRRCKGRIDTEVWAGVEGARMTVVVWRGRNGRAGNHADVGLEVNKEVEVDPATEGVGERGDEDGGWWSVGSGIYDISEVKS